MRPTRRVFHAYLLRVWEHWVVHVPDAHSVHAIVLDPSDAEGVARLAIGLVLDVDPANIRVVLDRYEPVPITAPGTARDAPPGTRRRPRTRREREVPAQAAVGMSNGQIDDAARGRRSGGDAPLQRDAAPVAARPNGGRTA